LTLPVHEIGTKSAAAARWRNFSLRGIRHPRQLWCQDRRKKITEMLYSDPMITCDLLREARLRSGLTQAELAKRLGKSQPIIARWESGDVLPSLETVREVIRGCGLELSFSLANADDSNIAIIDAHLRMTPAERFEDLKRRVAFQDRVRALRG
jgi:transcriptional regulator with XRE-family HTH domain